MNNYDLTPESQTFSIDTEITPPFPDISVDSEINKGYKKFALITKKLR